MNSFRLILRSLWFFRLSNLTLFAGVLVSVTVLTGALITGESMQYSLERIAVLRLGKISHAMGTRTYFRDRLAEEFSSAGVPAAAVIETEGFAISNTRQSRINRVMIYGIDEDFGKFWDDPSLPVNGEAVISANVAEQLGVRPGEDIVLRVSPVSNTPANAPFSSEKSPSIPLTVKVKGIAPRDGQGAFNLKASQIAPHIIYIHKKQLSRALGLWFRSNLLLLGDAAEPVTILRRAWNPHDAGIKITAGKKGFEIRAEQIFIPQDVTGVIMKDFPGAEGNLSWLVNEISSGSGNTPYSFVTATNHPFSGSQLRENEMIVSSWLAEDLKLKTGDPVRLKYFTIRQGRKLTEEEAVFKVAGILPVKDPVWDPELMPEFPGISDALNCRDWESGTPIDLKKIREKDEQYWNEHRGAPKAFISLEAGRRIWENPYGNLTSVRLSPETDISRLISGIITGIDPASLGLIIDPVAEKGEVAAQHATDFGGLFLGLGSLIILAGLLLTAMLFSLQLAGRLGEFHTYAALGFSGNKIFSLVYYESLIVLILAGIAGSVTGILYAGLMLKGLGTYWIPATGTSNLVLSFSWWHLVAGAVPGIIIASVILFFILRKKIFGKPSPPGNIRTINKQIFPSAWLLIKRQLLLNGWKSAGIILLVATGIFVIIITGVNYRERSAAYGKTSGTGGFITWAESSVPLPSNIAERLPEFGMDPSDNPLFRDVMLFPLPVLDQDDASCLNLNMTASPSLLGIPAREFSGRFTFASGNGDWSLLDMELSPGVIRGYVDATVLKWGMRGKPGDTVLYSDERGNILRVIVSGTLENSIFQGNLIISDSLLKKYYPSAISRILLVSGDPGKAGELPDALEQIFSSYGLMATATADRLAAFDSVQNTYLSVFMILGGLGILLATAGMGIFFIRETSSRLKEFALLKALGFTRSMVIFSASAGYLLLLISGILLGIILAIFMIRILALDAGFNINSVVYCLIIAVLLNGIVWIMASILILIKKNTLNSLRLE